ncbi:MAG: 4-hydroxy-tetrahydrodipicolinate reductase [Deltaproteobacteria bacterium]|nr:4-hydroxy-tetrahydrodipicolinate reductase [Deltaproteobacteria bacterium]
MSIKVIVNGASGRMGSLAAQAVEAADGLSLVGRADLGDNLRDMIGREKADVVVDFTAASVGYQMALDIIESGARPVIGTSGFILDQVKKLQELCKKQKVGGVIAPNFSISAVLMMKYAKDAARYLRDVEIVELHHDNKEEAPSGTAIRTAELIEEELGKTTGPKECREIVAHTRGGVHAGIAIHSIRLPGLVAHQEVLFGGLGQTLSIRSDTISRDSFMPGVVLACRKVVTADELYYGLEHLL